MKKVSTAAAVAIAMLLGACSSHSSTLTPTTASGPGGRTGATSVTPTEIHIAVVADINTALAPGLFQGSVDAVKGFADWINKQGGLAGRQVKVDSFDSKLNPDETKNALIQACQNDFALVGTTALFENNVDPIVQCKDAKGNATGMPEIPELTTDPAQQQSPVSFPINPPARDWSSPTFVAHLGIGPYRYYQQHITPDLHATWIYAGALKSTKTSEVYQTAALEQAGVVKLDQTFDLIGVEPQSAYDPVINAIKSHNSTLVTDGLDVTSDIKLRKEANVQGVTSVKVWDCVFTCYDRNFITLGGSDVEGEYVSSGIVPFEEADASKGVQEYLDAVGGISKASGFGSGAFLAALFFRDVINSLVAASGNNGLTRAAFLAAAKNQHSFTGDSMTAPIDMGARRGSGCFMLMQVQHGQFVRVYPAEKGKFDCSAANAVTLTTPPPGT